MRCEQDAERVVGLYSDMVKRVCFLHLKNHADTEDIFQNVFMKYILSSKTFQSLEHEKAWFLRVSINECKNLIKSFYRSKTVGLEEWDAQSTSYSDDTNEVLTAVLALPQKYKIAVYLFYYEGYTAVEISKMLHKNVNTIYTLLSRARTLLKETLGGELFE